MSNENKNVFLFTITYKPQRTNISVKLINENYVCFERLLEYGLVYVKKKQICLQKRTLISAQDGTKFFVYHTSRNGFVGKYSHLQPWAITSVRKSY
jgi:hypothetical protein